MNLALALLAATACATLHRRFGTAGRAVTIALTILLLAEFYVVKFPGGEPQPFPVPPVYKYVATLPPGAVLSLPDYARTDLWRTGIPLSTATRENSHRSLSTSPSA
jgi:hypothetical protein